MRVLTPREIAAANWGEPLPDWIEALVSACERSSQAKIAKRLGRSPALVSQVLRRKYTGDMKDVETRVRGAFMDAKVQCPALGLMPANECADWRTKSRRYVSANARRVMMFRACNDCPLNREET
jgi:hypothetical protein